MSLLLSWRASWRHILEEFPHGIFEFPLHSAAVRDQADVAEVLLEHGALADATDSELQTPLMVAAMSGSSKVVDLFLKRGVPVDTQDREGRTALMWAATKGDWPKIIELLVDAGAQVALKDRTGNTALSCAKLLGHSKTAHCGAITPASIGTEVHPSGRG